MFGDKLIEALKSMRLSEPTMWSSTVRTPVSSKTLKERIEELQELRIKEIKESGLSYKGQLELFEKERLFPIDNYMQNYLEDLEHLNTINGRYSFHESIYKYELVYFSELIDLADDAAQDNEGLVPVFVNDNEDKIFVALDVVVKTLYNYAIKHKISGFEFNW